MMFFGRFLLINFDTLALESKISTTADQTETLQTIMQGAQDAPEGENPQAANLCIHAAWIQIHKRKNNSAQNYLTLAQKFQPQKTAFYLYVESKLLLTQGKNEKAIQAIMQAIFLPKVEPLVAHLMIQEGLARLRSHEYEKALCSFNRALEFALFVDPNDYAFEVIMASEGNPARRAYLKQAQAHNKLGSYLTALECMKKTYEYGGSTTPLDRAYENTVHIESFIGLRQYVVAQPLATQTYNIYTDLNETSTPAHLRNVLNLLRICQGLGVNSTLWEEAELLCQRFPNSDFQAQLDEITSNCYIGLAALGF